jgi:hypothetical protein
MDDEAEGPEYDKQDWSICSPKVVNRLRMDFRKRSQTLNIETMWLAGNIDILIFQ